MTEENERIRDRFDLSLDGRQIASIVVGALVILGVVFVLGLNVGRQLAAREQVAGAGDALAALDQPNVPPSEPMRDDELTYGATLSKPAAPAPTAPAPAPAARIATPSPASSAPAAPAASATSAPAATPVPSAAQAAAPESSSATPAAAPAPTPPRPTLATTLRSPSAPSASASGTWTVQVGSAQDRAEATRLAKRFDRWSPRVETAELGSKGRWYRVRVGRYETREAAERFLRDLQRETGAKGYVTSAQ
jgi:DedD protein